MVELEDSKVTEKSKKGCKFFIKIARVVRLTREVQMAKPVDVEDLKYKFHEFQAVYSLAKYLKFMKPEQDKF